jgi:hypothetical protein
MSKDRDVHVRVEMCLKCPEIHLVIDDGVDFKCSVALTREEWAGLLGDYAELLAKQTGGLYATGRKH